MKIILSTTAAVTLLLTGCSALGGSDPQGQAASVCRDYAMFWLDVGDLKYSQEEMGRQMTSLQDRARKSGDTALTRYLEGMYNPATDTWSSLEDWASMAVRVAETCKTYGVPIATTAP